MKMQNVPTLLVTLNAPVIKDIVETESLSLVLVSKMHYIQTFPFILCIRLHVAVI